jgi:hypothetical protein
MGAVMMPRTVFLSRFLGLYCLIIGIAMLARGPAFAATVTAMLDDAPLSFVLGIITLFAGLAMVLTHNIWSGSALTIAVTVTGWLVLMKACLFLILTQEMQRALMIQFLHYQDLFYFYSSISVVIGLILTWGGFKKTEQANAD